MKTKDPRPEEIQRFVAGKSGRLRFGGYGDTVKVLRKDGVVVVEALQPKRKQKTVGPDGPETRRLAVAVARGVYQNLPWGGARSMALRTPVASPQGLTVGDIWKGFFRFKLPGAPDDVLEWGPRRILEYYADRSPAARKQLDSSDYIASNLTAARHLHREAVAPFHHLIDSVTETDLIDWRIKVLDRGLRERTVHTYQRRFEVAIRTFARKYPDLWEGHRDPTGTLDAVTITEAPPAEITDDQALALFDAFLELGEWRGLAAALIAFSSGRRIGEIAAKRSGKHLDDLPLRAADFEIEPEERPKVVWRAGPRKKRGFGRGDVMQDAPSLLSATVEWLVREHPNPAGPEYPLIWNADDPTQAETYDRLSAQLTRAWKHAFHEERPTGVAWHGYCRGTITTIVSRLGVKAAADFTGRTVETTLKYVRTREEDVSRTTVVLDADRRQALDMILRRQDGLSSSISEARQFKGVGDGH